MLGNELKGRYRIIRNLGVGGFGKTYLAKDTHRPGFPYCVVKQLMPLCSEIEFLQMARRLFKIEAEILEKLGRHPHIPHLLAYFEENKEFYLVEEFIAGSCLKDDLALGKCLRRSEVISLLRDILETLEFIHKQGIIHRDIKPSNLIRRQIDDRFILIDFGAVKQIQPHLLREQGDITLTTLTIAIGTADYAPIEQLAGQPQFSSDIYALGIVSIQALTGIPPKQLKREHHTRTIIWHHLAAVSPELAAIIDKMTHYQDTERYQSAAAVLEDLRQLNDFPAETSTFITPAAPASRVKLQHHDFSLSSEQYAQLEGILAEFVGSISHLLLKQAAGQVSNPQKLVDHLASHLPPQQQNAFLCKAIACLQKTTLQPQTNVQPQTQIVPSPPPQLQISVNDSFVNRCEKELTHIIGPISKFLIQQAMKSHPQLSVPELVELLAAEIPDSQQATEFRRRLLA